MWLADEHATEAAGALLGGQLVAGDVVALSGPLGAGKTCFTRGVLRALGFTADVPSPTFGIVIPYAPPAVRVPIWHVDLYRIDDPNEVDELGLDDARNGTTLIVEWPERMGAALWREALCIELAVEGCGRRLTATVPPSWEARWPFQ
jgi:tRNA threonylcarbamoyladenosine biosynthesis protein TsaE